MAFSKKLFLTRSRSESLEPIRDKDESMNEEDKIISVKGEKHVAYFEDGNWIVKEKSSPEDVNDELLKKLKEENNYLKLKIEVLLNMIAELQAKYEEHTSRKATEC